MKLFNRLTLALACTFLAAASSASAQDTNPQREHRAVWMTPFLGSNWPSSPITAGNATSLKTALTNRFDKFKEQNVNVVYYHVRSMCDAMYNSAYEPWSSSAAGKRGVAPVFDPFEFLVQAAHERGIEVYAWVNPYRYCGTSGGYGADNPIEYENAHPDWLIRQSRETILNPGIPEVRKRIADVCIDIVSKYDVDGVVFDDYFYSNPTPLSLDADLFNQYKANGGTITDQYAWRRANVNAMVKEVGEAIRATKDWVVFGIAPAGVCSPPNCQAEYGFPGPGTGSDWQYQSIASEPLNWVKNGYIDYIGPQIYWPNMYNTLESWWIKAAQTFNRHVYAALSISSAEDWGHKEFARELRYARENGLPNTAGVSWFHYGDFVNKREKVDVIGTTQSFADNIHDLVCPEKALSPLRPWHNVRQPAMVSNLTLSGSTLSWQKPAGDYRYCVYAIPADVTDAAFSMQKEYLHGITTLDTYTIPAEYATGYRWAVACYDRYGNEYSPALAGAAATTAAPAKLVYPADGGYATSIFNFSWTGEGNRFIVEMARDKDFSDIVGWIETGAHTANATALPTLVNGNTYYWRVRTHALNAPEVVSETAAFTARPMEITYPAVEASGVSVKPVITWDKAADGAEYLVEISEAQSFSDLRYSATTTATTHEVPDFTLSTGRKYYVRVTATLGETSAVTTTVPFTTENVDTYKAPVFVNPTVSGETLHANSVIKIEPVSGIYGVELYIANSTSFPARSSYKQSLLYFATESSPLSEVKLSSKYLEDGKTYYLRARGTYYLAGNTAVQYTDYTPAYEFTYSATDGVDDLFIDSANAPVKYYNLQGVPVDAGNLVPGIYIKRRGNVATKEYIR